MRKLVNTVYFADEGKLFVRIKDGKIFGRRLVLGVGSTIDMFEERKFSAEEIAKLNLSLKSERPQRRGLPAEKEK